MLSAAHPTRQKVATQSLWIKRWSALWSAGFALAVTMFFGSFAHRAWRIAAKSPPQRLEQAEALLRFVGDQLRNHNGAEQFEKFLPEAGIVAYTMYGEALVNLGVAMPTDVLKRARLAEEIKWCLDQLARPAVLEKFPHTQVPNGLFLLSRRTLLLAGLHLISDTIPFELVEEYHDNCEIMARAFESSQHGLLDSFPGFCWPTDNLAALRCLRLHDEKFGTDYSFAVEKWREWAQGALDPKYATLPFYVDSRSGEPLAATRGSALALSLIELRDVDEEMFREQYLRFREYFGNSVLGLRTWRESPEGRSLKTDIDTGPVIHGHGVMATLIGMTAAKLAGDLATFCDQMGLIEAIALPSTKDGMRRYLRGRLLILDALAAYAKSAVPWTGGASEIRQLSTSPRRPLLFVAVLMAIPFLTIASFAIRYARIVRKVRPLSLWRSESPSSEGSILFWCQTVVLVSFFFSPLWFPVIWAGFGILGRATSFGLRLARQGKSS